MKTIKVGVLLVMLACAGQVKAQVSARMLRFPDVSETRITFVYAGDIWVVDKAGGVASRLSSPSGEESFPRFSPDGRQIAFSGNYDGNEDIYIVPTGGGVPFRVTYHPSADRMTDWSPDGSSILFASRRESGSQRFRQLYQVPVTGGLPQKLPLPYGEFATFSPDGKHLAFQTLTRDFRTWKRYRGGTAPEIWIADLETLETVNMTNDPANDSQAMWHGSRVYFLSDRGEYMRNNIWFHDTETGETSQLTRFAKYDVRFPSIGPSDIVFEAGGRLGLLSLSTNTYKEIEVRVVTDHLTLKPGPKDVSGLILHADVSPSGKRAVFEARGELFTVPAEHGVIRQLTRTSGAAERYPAWSPDGKRIAYFSDESGEYELNLRNADGSGTPETLTDLGPGFRYNLFWSPDSSKVAFIDQLLTIQIVDVDSRAVTEVDKALFITHGGLEGFRPSWSGDGRWLAFSRQTTEQRSAIFLHDTRTGETHQVTSAYYNDAVPVFDPDGKYLYYLSDRNFEVAYSDVDNSWIYANSTELAAVPLRLDVADPLAPRNDEEEAEEDEEATSGESDDGDDDDGGEGDDVAPVEIELEGFETRVRILPPTPGNWGRLAAVSGKVVYQRAPRTGEPDGSSSPIRFYDLEEREEETVIEDADDFSIAAGGEKVLIASDGQFAIVDLAADQAMEKPLRTGELEATVDPRQEWRQIFNDSWRLMRDYFYDPNMHGVDWEAMRIQYGAMIDDAVTRWDVHFVIGELIAELNVSHSYRGGGDMEMAQNRGVGLLGCDFEVADGAFRIARILDGGAWDSEVRSPLLRAGVQEGSYLLAVNGVPVDVAKDPWASLQGTAGQTVLLTVNDSPELSGAREVLIETLSSEVRLRNLAWIEAAREWVDEASEGKVGYVYIPDTGLDGQSELVRQFAAQAARPGMIFDERFNSGGQFPDRFVELMNRPRSGYIGFRASPPVFWSPLSSTGAQVMLINAWAGSGGDLLPYLFKQAGLGPLIGTRTWGGLVGISGAPDLIDGGVVTLPNLALYGTDGEWLIEGHGVEPDIEVIDDPGVLARGEDPQLARALEEVLRLLDESPPVFVDPPPFDDRTAAGLRQQSSEGAANQP